MVWTPGQPICLIKLARFRNDDIVIGAQKDGPNRLATCECLLRGEIFEVHVVQKNLCLMNITLKVMMEVFQGLDNCQEFLVIDFIVSFCGL